MDPLTRLRQRRRRQFLNHMIAYFAVMVVLVPLNRFLYPDAPIFVFVMVAWGAPLAVHAAWAMELFGPIRLPPEAAPHHTTPHRAAARAASGGASGAGTADAADLRQNAPADEGDDH
ncbi:MAG: 2TM domain-containing protein [Rhodospirillaceae bacterium]|nr:2TM domain-containing protein [Rhodospirillaceae bacterium]MCA8931552.1 2TM domain-containing protein [Rhodospirillaceae bacterium]